MKKTILPYVIIGGLAVMSIWGFTAKPEGGGGYATMQIVEANEAYCAIVYEDGKFETQKLEKQKLSNGTSTHLVSITQILNDMRGKGYVLISSHQSLSPNTLTEYVFEKE